MREKTELKQKAILMRKEGNTYTEILEKVPVAKSTLSLWLHDVGLAKHQKQRLTQKKLEAGRRGGEAKRKQRIEFSEITLRNAQSEIGKISKRELWLIGILLYWGEGSKEKDWKPGSGVVFTNMDYKMIQVFLKWLSLCKIQKSSIWFELYVHEQYRGRVQDMISFWMQKTGFPKESFSRVYYKKWNGRTLRKNTGERYNGVLRVRIHESSTLLRRIAGWTNGIYNDINKRT